MCDADEEEDARCPYALLYPASIILKNSVSSRACYDSTNVLRSVLCILLTVFSAMFMKCLDIWQVTAARAMDRTVRTFYYFLGTFSRFGCMLMCARAYS